VRQHYRNDGPNNIEVSYVFPLAHEAMLAGMSVELNGKRLDGEIKPKRQAEATYEQAIDEGDTPVMLSEKSHGLYSADLGNLQPGDQAVIELRLLQTVAVDNGRVRLVFPTVIAPRYGDEHIQGGLEPHETTRADVMAEYGFFAQLTVMGQSEQMGLQVHCPSHAITTLPLHNSAQGGEGGIQVNLSDKAWLDQDWVLELKGYAQNNNLQTLHSHGYTVGLATFVPQWVPTAPEQPLQLKLLVDCSGSMAGIAMLQAKRALHDISSHLAEGDSVSLTAFGTQTEHLVKKLTPVSPSFLRKTYAPYVDSLEADMGGTEMVKALEKTLLIKGGNSHHTQDVLLITDGAVWDVDEMLRTALDTGHRVFCVGVGHAHAESLLSQLAEQTGGACVFVTANENMSEPIQRMMHRMRLGQPAHLQVNWSTPMEWTSPLPRLIAPGETVQVFGISKKVDESEYEHTPAVTALQAELNWAVEGNGEAANGCIKAEINTKTATEGGTSGNTNLARLAFHQRLRTEKDSALSTAWALEQQLLSKETKMILVHVREEDQKAATLPRLHQVEQMSVMLHDMSNAVPSVWRSRERSSSSMKFGKEKPQDGVMRMMRSSTHSIDFYMDPNFEVPAFLRKQDGDAKVNVTEAPKVKHHSDLRKMRESLLNRFDELATHESDPVLVWSRFIQGTQATDSIKSLLKDIQALGIDENTAWAVLLQWLNNFTMESEVLSRYGRRMLIMTRKHLDEETTHRAYELCLGVWD
jgi:Ca-activated chloride channel family protein